MATRNKSKPAPQPEPKTSQPSALRLRTLAGAALIVLAVVLAYLPAIKGGFILDDDALLTDSPLIKASDGLYRIWFTTEAVDCWPVASSTLWLEWRLWGMDSTGYHVTNLVVHLVTVFLLWRLLWRLSIPGAFLAALLFAVHPVNVESVAWIAQRKNLLAMMFFLLSILGYLKSERQSAPQSHRSLMDRWYWLSLGAFVLALLSKVSVAILPLLLLGIIWWMRPLTRRDLLRVAPFFLIAAVLVRVNMWFLTHNFKREVPTVGFVERLLGAGGAVWFYLSKAILPVNLVFIYPEWRIHADQLQWWLPLLAAVAVTCLLWRYRRSWGRPLLLAWGYFCVSLVPVLGFTDVGLRQPLLLADHYQHIALIGVIALVAAGWGTWQHRAHQSARWVPNAAAVCIGSVLTFLTWHQSRLYANAVTLYEATLEKNPGAWMAHNNLGYALRDAGRLQEATEHFEQALRLNPEYSEAHNNPDVAVRLPEAENNLGSVLADSGRLEEAIQHYEQALRLRPGFPEVRNNLGKALAAAGRLQEATEQYKQALELKPDYPDAQFNLGLALVEAGQVQEAIGHYQQALRLKPDYPEAHTNLGNALAKTGRLREAIEHYEQAVRFNPTSAKAHTNLGNALAAAGRLQEAVEQYEQAVRLKPEDPDTHYSLGNALTTAGRLQEAVEQYQQVLRVKPDYPEALYNLGSALARLGRVPEAIEQYKHVLRLTPEDPEAWANLAFAYGDAGKSSEAIDAAQKALEMARSKGQSAVIETVQEWLDAHRAGQPDPAPVAPPR